MADIAEQARSETPASLKWSMMAGFLAWGADLGFSYALTQHVCSTGHIYVLRMITILALTAALSGFVAGLAEHRKLAEGANEQGSSARDRAFFQAKLGIAFSLAFSVVIVAAAVPRWILSPCS